jgi:serine/threonine protein kinase
MWTALEGVMVGGRYELSAHLASGGMATVFRGWDHRLRRPVAIKMLQELDSAGARDVERFRREARAAAALASPHIVEVYDFFADEGCYYLVMELVEGVDLKHHLRAHGPVPVAEALVIATQICLALDEAHAQGFIHRDIKPQNILLDASGTAKLADFGIVQIPGARQCTSGGMVMGTADYVSPEQAQGLPLTPASDLYSLGVVLYEMLTGMPPFTGRTAVAVAMRHASTPPPPPRKRNPAISPGVERLVLRALAKDPHCRYPSARAMAEAIAHALAEVTVVQAPVGAICASACMAGASADVLADAPALALDWRTMAGDDRPPAPDDRMADTDSKTDQPGDLSTADVQALFQPEHPPAFHISALLLDPDASPGLRLIATTLVAAVLLAAVVFLHMMV